MALRDGTEAVHLTLDIPDDLAKRLAATPNHLARRALEALVVEEFKAGHLSRDDVRRALGLATSIEVDAFLADRDIFERYSAEDLARDREELRRLGL